MGIASDARDMGLAKRVAIIASRLTIILGLGSAAIYSLDLATRPACPPHYVRLIDVEPALLGLSLILAIFGAGLLARLQGRRRPVDRLGGPGIWGAVGFGTILAVLTCLLAVTALWLVVVHDGGHELTCWTF
jgi:hypothetical protein